MSDQLPKGWAYVELRECADVLDNQRVPVNSDERAKRQGDIPYYGATGRVGWINEALFDGELLLVGEDGAPFFDKSKPIAYIINGKSWVNNHAHVLRAKAPISSNQFLKFFLNWLDFREYVNGTTRLKLTQGAMNGIPVRLAPLPEQRRIVAKLEALLAKVDTCQQRLARIPLLLKRFRQSVLAAACSGRLTADWREENSEVEPAPATLARLKVSAASARVRRGVPERVPASDLVAEWNLPATWGSYSAAELLRCRAFLDVKDGNHGANHPKVSEFTEIGFPFITAAQVNNYRIDYDGAYKLSGEPLNRIHVGLAKSGDVIYTHKGSVGRVAVADRECVLTPQTTYYRVNPEVFANGFVMFYLTSQAFSDQVNVVKEQTTRDFVPISEQYLLFHRVPPLPEQHEIVRRVEFLFALADQIEARFTKAQQQVDKLSPSLLAKAFRGELVAQDPRDEPASKLLERIKLTRTRSPLPSQPSPAERRTRPAP
jgi:type I restriction enzyme, S subunit